MPRRKCCGISKKLPGTTVVSNSLRNSFAEIIRVPVELAAEKRSCRTRGAQIEIIFLRIEELVEHAAIRFEQLLRTPGKLLNGQTQSRSFVRLHGPGSHPSNL